MPGTTPQWTVLTYLADELSELVQVALAIGGDAQLSDAAVELLSSIKRVLGTQCRHRSTIKIRRQEGPFFFFYI